MSKEYIKPGYATLATFTAEKHFQTTKQKERGEVQGDEEVLLQSWDSEVPRPWHQVAEEYFHLVKEYECLIVKRK
tara:strand:- start:293 stop:517 length:225 start_codon:yes stop_codon:yes gene_type:complete